MWYEEQVVLKTANATGALPAMVRVPLGFTKNVSDRMQGMVLNLVAHHVLCACNVLALTISHLISFTSPIWLVFHSRPTTVVLNLWVPTHFWVAKDSQWVARCL